MIHAEPVQVTIIAATIFWIGFITLFIFMLIGLMRFYKS